MENTSEPKKRKADPTKYKRKIIKKSRVEGTPYTNYRNKQIPLKVVRLPCRQVINYNGFVIFLTSTAHVLQLQTEMF